MNSITYETVVLKFIETVTTYGAVPGVHGRVELVGRQYAGQQSNPLQALRQPQPRRQALGGVYPSHTLTDVSSV